MTDAMATTERLRIDSIQGLRGLAALLVVVSHQLPAVGISKENGYYAGTLGVMMFFVISGFIMTATSYDRFGIKTAPSEFLWRRIVRIVPLYWLATSVYALKLAIMGEPVTIVDLVKSLTFIPYLTDGLFRPIYGLGWTLNYEMFFYALFALALNLRVYAGLLTLFVVFLCLTCAGYVLPSARSTSELVTFYTDTIMLYFVAGVAIGIVHRRAARAHGLSRHQVVETFLAIATVTVLFVSAASYFPWLRNLQSCLCVGAVILCAFNSRRSHGRMERCVLLLGNASYSIYLTHSFVAGPVKRYWHLTFGTDYPLLMVALITAGSIAVGLACYRWVEQPLLRTKWFLNVFFTKAVAR